MSFSTLSMSGWPLVLSCFAVHPRSPEVMQRATGNGLALPDESIADVMAAHTGSPALNLFLSSEGETEVERDGGMLRTVTRRNRR